jgi:LPXTG-motif cell wall-anchored protein
VPQPITDGTNDGTGTVDATSGGSTSDVPGGGVPATGDGAPPQVNPATGAGRNDLPSWLGIAGALMMLGGWLLRRTGRAGVAAPAQATSDH